MKPLKTTMLLISLILSLTTICQIQLPNTHWVNNKTISSPSLHLYFEGYENGQYKYVVENKQPCNVNMRIYGVGSQDTIVNVQSHKTKHLSFIAPFAGDTIWCKALDSCSSTYDTCYWGVLTAYILPIHFKSAPKIERLLNGELKVTFDVSEASNVRQFNIKTSKDYGKTWIISAVKLPETTLPNQKYSVIIKP